MHFHNHDYIKGGSIFIVDSLQLKLHRVNLIGRSWRTWKTNCATPTYAIPV